MKKLIAMFLVLTVTCSFSYAGVSITEFLNNVYGDENSNEWVEIFNYGPGSVDLQNWTLNDDGGESAIITSSSRTLAVGEYAVLADDLLQFTSVWPTVDSSKVIDVEGNFALGNSGDEIILNDSSDATVWQLAYPNGETAGRAVFLTLTNTWSINNYGSEADPGIVFDGDDDPVGSGLGYQSNNRTTDPNAFTSELGDTGSPGTGNYVAIPEPAAFGLIALAILFFRKK